MAKAASQRSLERWTKQKWRTKSGKKSSKTGERYLPEAAIKALTPAEYAATSRAKRAGTKKGKQFVKQPQKIAEKTRAYRGGSLRRSSKPSRRRSRASAMRQARKK